MGAVSWKRVEGKSLAGGQTRAGCAEFSRHETTHTLRFTQLLRSLGFSTLRGSAARPVRFSCPFSVLPAKSSGYIIRFFEMARLVLG